MPYERQLVAERPLVRRRDASARRPRRAVSFTRFVRSSAPSPRSSAVAKRVIDTRCSAPTLSATPSRGRRARRARRCVSVDADDLVATSRTERAAAARARSRRTAVKSPSSTSEPAYAVSSSARCRARLRARRGAPRRRSSTGRCGPSSADTSLSAYVRRPASSPRSAAVLRARCRASGSMRAARLPRAVEPGRASARRAHVEHAR